MTKFVKGMPVMREMHGAGCVTTSDAIVGEVDDRGVWLDNGPGNDPSGPFNPRTGWGERVMGMQQRIRLKLEAK